MITLFKSKYLLEINYKSGISKEIWVTEYEIDISQAESVRTFNRVYLRNSKKALAVNVDAIESIFLLKKRKNVFKILVDIYK